MVKHHHHLAAKVALREVAAVRPVRVPEKVANAVVLGRKVACAKEAKDVLRGRPPREENAVAVVLKVVKAESKGKPPRAASVANAVEAGCARVVSAPLASEAVKVVASAVVPGLREWRPVKVASAKVGVEARSIRTITTMPSP